ncbi:MAG: MAE_28990/MAE_18760 family HEPN-like nuclease [Bacillota bacterium]|jgi:hypothetical protein
MPVRSKEELIDRLSKISKARRRELITLDQLIGSWRKHEREIACQSAIVFSYAHWEGFVKEAAVSYIEYVAFKSPLLGKLTANFQAIVCRSYLIKATQASKRIAPHLEVVYQLTDCLMSQAKINPKTAIDTESNLNSQVLENICHTVGIDYAARWSRYGPFIDDLVENRCAIAHGEFRRLDEKYAREALRFTLDAIAWFRTDIENAVLMDAYLRK